MAPLRVYLDTSVLGGYFDRAFETDSRKLVRHIQDGEITPFLSDMVVAEVAEAPEAVRSLLEKLIRDGAEVLASGADAVSLQEAYLQGAFLGADGAMMRCTLQWPPWRAWTLSHPGTSSTW
jgi:hypothetical protein